MSVAAESRRRFLGNLLSAATALAVVPAWLRSESAFAGDAARFADSLKKKPWLLGWKSVTAEALGPTTVDIEGHLPIGFAGTLYRNGPAWIERDAFRYEHWFDGDGMVHGWRFGAGKVTHRAHMVATPKFTREQKAARFLYPTSGTYIADARAVRNSDDVSVANTSVMVLNGRLFALWEAGSAFELDPDQLTTIGPVSWRPDLASVPFSAHPLPDRDGSYWNFGSLNLAGGSSILIWHLGADGKLISADVLETPVQGFLHSFAMTDRHLVFALIPFAYAEGEGRFFERIRFQPDQPLRVAVVAKDAPTRARWFEADFAAVFHFADAYERHGRIVMRAVPHADVDEARSPMRATMSGDAEPQREIGRLRELHLDLRSGQARWQDTGILGIEFPLFDPRTRGDGPAIVYAPAHAGEADAPYFNAVAAYDVARGRHEVHRYGRDILSEEHVFVPKPGRSRAGEGWLVGTLLDSARGRSGIAVLDAERVNDGPLAQAWLPYSFPLGFHGRFAAS
ncbi:MAG: carotenoid oxygenase family protein [Pseudomonas fluorescens]